MDTRTELRERLRRSRNWVVAIDELEREAESLQSERERSERLFELAALTEEVVPERDRALAFYQRAWKLYPENLKALARAREVYRELGRLEMVAKLGEIELKSGVGDTGRLAAIVGEALLDCGQRERALPLLQQALEADPDSTRLKDAIAALNYDRELWGDVVERLVAESERNDSATAARMLLRAARIVHLETPGHEDYEALLRKVLENEPQNEHGNFLLESLLAAQQRWDELEMHHERRAYAAPDEGARAALYRTFALEWVQRFKDRERGAKFFNKALLSASENGTTKPMRSAVAGFSLLREFYGASERWADLLAVGDAVLGHLNDDERLFVAVQSGLVAWKQLGDETRAHAYFDIVRQIEPEAPDLADFDAVVAPPHRGESEETEVHEADTNNNESIAVHSTEAEPAAIAPNDEAGGAIGPTGGASSADVEDASSVEAAARPVIPAAVIEPPSAAAEAQIAALLAQEDARHGARALQEMADSAESTADKVAALVALAELQTDKLNQDTLATRTLDQALELQPGNLSIYDRLAALYESRKRWPDLVKTLDAKAEHLQEHGAKVELRLAIARLYIERFSNQAEAIKSFEVVLELEPDNEEATRHLLEVYEKRRDWEKLISLREREITRTEDPSERAAKTYEVAQLAAARVKKPDVCIVWWERVLADDPANEEAIGELYKLYERSKEWGKLAEICAKQAAIAPDEKTQVEALQKLGLLYTDKVEDADKAIDAWRRLLDIDPEHRRAQDSLKKLYVSAKRWEELEAFYRSSGKLDEFVRVLEREVDSAADADKLELAMKIAVTYRDEVDKSDRAMRAFEKVLSIDENNLEAAEALIPLYEQGRDPRKLVRVLEIQLESTDDAALRQERYKRLAEYSEERLRDKGAAFGWWLKAQAEDYRAEWIRAELERLAQETGAWNELVDAYEASYGKFGDSPQERRESLPLLGVVARVLEQELGEIDRALATNRTILELDDDNEAALAALERLYLGKEQFEDLLAVYEKKLELTPDADAQTEIRYKIGQLYEDEVKDDERAIAAYEAVLAANGEDPVALGALDRIYSRNERWQDLAAVLERKLGIIGPDDDREAHLEAKYRLGSVRQEHLRDLDGAIASYSDILSIEPSHVGAREALEQRLDDEAHQLEVANILEPIYEQLEEWASLVRAHEIQLAAETDSLRRVGLLMRIGELHAKRLGDAEKAFDAFARCFEEDPSVSGAKAALEELSGLVGDGWTRLVALFEGALATPDLDPVLGHELAIKVARAYETRLENTDKAVEYYRRALQIEPDDLAAIEALELIFSRDERYAELLEVYRKKADITADPDERLNILFRIASIHEEMLGSPEDAISAYNEILGQDGDNLRALRALDRLYNQGRQWEDLADNLGRQLILSSDDDNDRVQLLVRLAQLRQQHLEETTAAIETYRQVLELQPHNPDAIAALEHLLGSADHELAIAQILEPIYRARSDWQKQIGIYEIMARHAYDPERKIELLHQISELHELGGDDGAAAFETYARAFREEPRSENTQAQLERLARATDRLRDLVTLYDEVIAEVADEDLKVHLLIKLAQLHEHELGNDASAVQTYARILEVSPGYVEAASSIQNIHERNADYPALVGTLKRKAEIIIDLPERKQLLYKAAQIQEEVLEDAHAAIESYQSVLELDDIDVPAMDALERLYIRLELWEPLKDVYAKKADLAEDPQDKKQMLYVLGQVYDRELSDVGKAVETYQAILDIDPDELPAIQSLDRLLGQAERWYDLLANLERQVELAETTGEMVALKYRIGELWQNKLGDSARAIDSYREALELDPANQETLIALDGLLRSEEGEPVMAARVLEPIYEAQGEYANLIEVLDVMAAHADDSVQKVELLQRIAELYESRLELPSEAFDAQCRALREDNSNELTLAHLERLAEWTSAWRQLAELYGAEADKSLDVPRQVDLLSRLARVQEEELGHTDAAIATYRRISDVEFDNRTAVLALDRLYTGAERWQELAEVLRKEIQLADSDDEIIALQFRLGQVLEQALGDARAAIEVYRDILATAPSHGATQTALEMLFLDGHHQGEIAEVLEPLYEAAGEFEKLHKILEVQLSRLSEPADRQSMFQRLAELAERHLYDQQRALHWWSEAAVEDPRWELAISEAERLAGELGAWQELVDVNDRILARHDDQEVQRQSLLRTAHIYESYLGEQERAVQTLLRALEIDSKDAEALTSLDRLYGATGRYEELVDVLRRRIEVTLDGDELIDLQFRRGRVFADALGDLDSALACYEAVLEQESRNRTALESIELIYFRREEWQTLYETYEKMIDVADGDEELAGVYAHMARLCSDALERDHDASDLWGRVLDIRGENPQALAALAELHGRREQWDDLVEIIERQIGVAESERHQIVLYKRLGRVWAEKLGRERNALDAWLAADQLDSQDLETLQTLAHLYRQTQSWDELSQTLRRIVEVGQISGQLSEDDMIELQAQLGQLEGEILGRVDDAVDAWRRVVALDPSDFRALDALEQLFTREARWEECIEVLEKRALVVDDDQARIDTLLQAAATWEEKVENLDAAAAVYERVRQMEPGNVIASERLEDIYRQQYKWENLNEVLLERVEQRENSSERIEILISVAKIYENELGDQENAFFVYQYAFREDYSHEQTAKNLERLAEATGQWQDLLNEYTERVTKLEHEDVESAADLWVKIGRWYGEHLAHIEWAIHSVNQALRLDSNHVGALSALADLQRKRASWAELIETLYKHAAVEPSTQRKVELYLELAELLETQMQDTGQAISAYQSALEADPSSMAALSSLERLYRRQEMWERLIWTLGQMAELRGEDEIIRLKLEIGALWDQRMGDAAEAIGAYRDVLEIDPSNLAALRALEHLYEKTGQSEQYLEILEAQLDASPTDAEQIALYERMSAAWEERFGKLDRAAECLEKIVALDERNFSAYEELARLYRQAERWDSLVDTYRNHIMATSDPATRVDLYVAMGSVYQQRLGDVDRAIEAFTDVLTFNPDEPRALAALGRLYEGVSEWDRAIDVMSQLVQTSSDPLERVELHYRIGRISYEHQGDAEEGESQFLAALNENPAHVPSMEALVELYSQRGDWMKAAQMMIRAEQVASSVLDKVRLLYQAARIYHDRLGNIEQAKVLFGQVVELDPEHVGSAEPLAELYFREQDWARLSPLLDMLVRKYQQEQRDPRVLNELYFRTAKTADALGDYEKALNFYKGAYDIDSTYLPTLMGRADLLYKMQDWDAAGKIYQTILVQHRDSQAEADVVRIYYRLGMVRLQLDERKKALNMFEKALEIDPTHPDTLLAVIDIQAAQGDYEAVVQAKRALMATANDDERVQLLDEIGSIYHDQLSNPQKSISSYLEALDVRGDDHQLLQKVLDLYTETEQWKKAVETIERFIELERDPIRKGSYYQAAGLICRDKLKALDEAIEYFNKALDNFFIDPDRIPSSFRPRVLKAFADIDKILTTKRDWKAQERAYRQMIKRMKAGDAVLVDLWHALGEIYRSRLKHYESAIQAFEIAQQLQPTNTGRGEILAELYLVAGPDYADKAIEQHMKMLHLDPFKYDSYKALRRIYMDTHQYDKTWCVCNALAFLKKADPEEIQFYEQYQPRVFKKAKQRMTEEMWRLVYHPDENRYISAILGAIWQGAASMRAQPHKAFGLRRKDRRNLEQDQLMFSKLFLYVAQVLNVPMPEVYLQEDQPGDILLAVCAEKNQLLPSFVVRQNLLQGRPEREVAFVAARKLAYMRPEHFLKLALTTNTELKTALLSAIVLVKRDFPIPPDMQPLVAQYLPEMQKRIPPHVFEQLAMVVNRFLQNAPEVNMARWGHAVDATGHRVGFIIAGDLEVAARMIAAEPVVVGGPQVKDKIKELVLYSVSEDYFAVRQHLDLTIG